MARSHVKMKSRKMWNHSDSDELLNAFIIFPTSETIALWLRNWTCKKPRGVACTSTGCMGVELVGCREQCMFVFSIVPHLPSGLDADVNKNSGKIDFTELDKSRMGIFRRAVSKKKRIPQMLKKEHIGGIIMSLVLLRERLMALEEQK